MPDVLPCMPDVLCVVSAPRHFIGHPCQTSFASSQYYCQPICQTSFFFISVEVSSWNAADTASGLPVDDILINSRYSVCSAFTGQRVHGSPAFGNPTFVIADNSVLTSPGIRQSDLRHWAFDIRQSNSGFRLWLIDLLPLSCRHDSSPQSSTCI